MDGAWRSSSPGVLPSPVEPKTADGRYMVVIFNNDDTPYDAVIEVLMRATGCDFDEAAIETWEAHNYGQASVHFASEDECLVAAKVIGTAGVSTEVRREWDD
ncbi:MAG: ATP-dependent Clp protease adaptor ClpS [Fimbriimonadaceae bacterium]|nr:ATP-dependent Clp protease adaptor ClpS [Fimbriimonadaceae bacterium]QYK57927.1 MAG: ATP-dependent Clp protease adaptor ClpS [Fimbriimonadaceae bacterium]